MEKTGIDWNMLGKGLNGLEYAGIGWNGLESTGIGLHRILSDFDACKYREI